jgi:hypothetical protein
VRRAETVGLLGGTSLRRPVREMVTTMAPTPRLVAGLSAGAFRGGLTRVELLVVIVISGILVSLRLPAVQAAARRGR